MDFCGKVAIVTGATSGIGEETARQLMAKGAQVLAVGRSAEKGAELEQTDYASVQRMAEAAHAWKGHVDILINNAGMSVDGTVETLALEQWEKIFALNVTSIFLMSK